jgi:hypothetical protein
MFRFQTQTARDASGASIRGGLRRSPPWAKIAVLSFVGRSLPVYLDQRTSSDRARMCLPGKMVGSNVNGVNLIVCEGVCTEN